MNNQDITEITFNCVATETHKAVKQHKLFRAHDLNREYKKLMNELNIEVL